MKYPIGIQTFEEIIEEGYVYIDKTKSIYKLIDEGKFYFLSRPRRFGKSLLLSTIKAVFEGKKELFKGLFIENKIEWKKYPVVHLSLNSYSNKEIDMREALKGQLDSIAGFYKIQLNRSDLGGRFAELLQQLSQHGKVVLLIDKYDKPLISFLDDMETFEKNRNILKEFYGVIKDSDPYLKFVLITGVSRFARVSVFSDLNNLSDISLESDYCDICGYSEADIHHYFTPRIAEIAKEMNISTEELFEKVRKKYDGYNFYGEPKMYNPWSVLNFLAKRKLDNYWFATGTPTFLTKFADHFQVSSEGVTADKTELGILRFDENGMNALLYQTGYLTIDEEIDDALFTLRHPNEEVSESFTRFLLAEFANLSTGNVRHIALNVRNALKMKDKDKFIAALNPIFANIPSQIFNKDKEAYYHSVVHLVFMMLRYNIQSEVNTKVGRIDSVISAWNEVWIFEFKLNSSAEVAYNQIVSHNYAEQYQNSGREIYGVGVNFNSETKKITEVKMEKLS